MSSNSILTLADIKLDRSTRYDVGSVLAYAVDISGDPVIVGACDEIDSGNILPDGIDKNMYIISSSANDVSGGSAAHQVVVLGLNSSYAPIVQSVDCSGTDQKLIDSSFMCINDAYVSVSDASNSVTNAGQIDITNSGQTAVYRSIQICPDGVNGMCQSSDGYVVNSSKESSVIQTITAWTRTGGSATIELTLSVKQYGLPPRVVWSGSVSSDNPKTWKLDGIKVPPKAIAYLQAKRAAGSGLQAVWCQVEYLRYTAY